MARRLVITRKAYLDIDRIINFNNKRNQTDIYSRRVTKNLFKKFKELSLAPSIGITTERQNTLVLIWDQFYIFYKPEENIILITSVYHQKEDVNL